MKGFLNASVPMRSYAEAQANTLVRRLAYQVNRTVKRADADSIHDLRLAVRRLSQCLETFAGLFPKGAAKKVAGRVDQIRKLAGGVRNHDIAIEYLEKSGGSAGLIDKLRRERRDSVRDLLKKLDAWNKREPWRKWRTRLEI